MSPALPGRFLTTGPTGKSNMYSSTINFNSKLIRGKHNLDLDGRSSLKEGVSLFSMHLSVLANVVFLEKLGEEPCQTTLKFQNLGQLL